jgi:hypothetical protein
MARGVPYFFLAIGGWGVLILRHHPLWRVAYIRFNIQYTRMLHILGIEIHIHAFIQRVEATYSIYSGGCSRFPCSAYFWCHWSIHRDRIELGLFPEWSRIHSCIDTAFTSVWRVLFLRVRTQRWSNIWYVCESFFVMYPVLCQHEHAVRDYQPFWDRQETCRPWEAQKQIVAVDDILQSH